MKLRLPHHWNTLYENTGEEQQARLRRPPRPSSNDLMDYYTLGSPDLTPTAPSALVKDVEMPIVKQQMEQELLRHPMPIWFAYLATGEFSMMIWS